MRDRDIDKGWDSDLGLSYIPKAELFGWGQGRRVVPGWDSDFGLSYIPKAELFGVAGVGQEAANCR